MLVSQDTKSPPDQNILLKMSKKKHLQAGDKIHQTGTLFYCSCPIPIPHHKRWVAKVIEGNDEWQWKEALTSVDIILPGRHHEFITTSIILVYPFK